MLFSSVSFEQSKRKTTRERPSNPESTLHARERELTESATPTFIKRRAVQVVRCNFVFFSKRHSQSHPTDDGIDQAVRSPLLFRIVVKELQKKRFPQKWWSFSLKIWIFWNRTWSIRFPFPPKKSEKTLISLPYIFFSIHSEEDGEKFIERNFSLILLSKKIQKENSSKSVSLNVCWICFEKKKSDSQLHVWIKLLSRFTLFHSSSRFQRLWSRYHYSSISSIAAKK